MDQFLGIANPKCPDRLTRCYFSTNGYQCDDCISLVGGGIGTTPWDRLKTWNLSYVG